MKKTLYHVYTLVDLGIVKINEKEVVNETDSSYMLDKKQPIAKRVPKNKVNKIVDSIVEGNKMAYVDDIEKLEPLYNDMVIFVKKTLDTRLDKTQSALNSLNNSKFKIN